MSRNSLTGRRVLVVEDEVMIADDMTEDLASRGAEVLGPATRLEEAEALIAANPHIDAAVLDINLRGQMTYGLADRLIERGVPIVFATGYDQFVVPERFAGVPRCEKPVRAEMLLQALEQAAVAPRA